MHINFSDLFLKIEKQLEDPQAVIDENLLIELVNVIRPSNPQDTDEIKKKIQAFIESLLRTPTAPFLLQTFLLRLINRYKQVSLYADSGILSLDGFGTSLCKESEHIFYR